MKLAPNNSFSIADRVKLEAKEPGVSVPDFLRKSGQSQSDFVSKAPYPETYTPGEVSKMNSSLRNVAEGADERFHRDSSWMHQDQQLSLLDLSRAFKESSEIVFAQAKESDKCGSRRDAWTKPLAALSLGGFVTSVLPMVGTAGHIAGVATGIVAMAAAGINEYFANADHNWARYRSEVANADLTASELYKGWQTSLSQTEPPKN